MLIRRYRRTPKWGRLAPVAIEAPGRPGMRAGTSTTIGRSRNGVRPLSKPSAVASMSR